MDYNAHMRNTAYLDYSATVRMLYFEQNGFPVSGFARLKVGPVVLKDEIVYFKEIKLLEQFEVTLELVDISDDGRKCTLRNRFFKSGEVVAAEVTTLVGWLDLAERKLVTPPENLLDALKNIG